MSSLSLPLLLGIFAAAAAIIWGAGIQLSNHTDVLATRPDLEVADPIGGSNRAFRACAAELDQLIERFVRLAWPPGTDPDHDALAPRHTPRSV